MLPGTDIQRDATVYCADGPAGAVRQVVIDPAHGDVTELVIERDDGERVVVPAAAIARADGQSVTLALRRADLAGDVMLARYRPEEYRPLHEVVTQRLATPTAPIAPVTAEQHTIPTTPLVPERPPATTRIDTTDPAALLAFAPATLRLPLRGQALDVAREILVIGELVVSKRLRQERVFITDTVRKERVEVRRRER